MSTTRLPVLFLTDLVVLPGMVVPIELDDSRRSDRSEKRRMGDLILCRQSRPERARMLE